MGKEIVLPKNIRQIGDIDGSERIYVEDYVTTYIRKKEAQEEQGYLGIFLGESSENREGSYVFIRGILEVPLDKGRLQEMQRESVESAAGMREDAAEKADGAAYKADEAAYKADEAADKADEAGGKTAAVQQDLSKEDVNKLLKESLKEASKVVSEEAEKELLPEPEKAAVRKPLEKLQRESAKAPAEDASEEIPREVLKEVIHRARIEYFPGWDVQGYCVIGKYPSRQMEQLSGIFPQAGRLIYHLQEQEESLYWKSQDAYRRIRGYFVFYEQNRKMQEYLSDVFRDATVEQESRPEKAIRTFREKVREKSEKKAGSMLKLASSFFVVTVLVIGAVVVNKVEEVRDVQNVTGTGGQEQTELLQEQTAQQVWIHKNRMEENPAQNEAELFADDTWMAGSEAFWADSELEVAAQTGISGEGTAEAASQTGASVEGEAGTVTQTGASGESAAAQIGVSVEGEAGTVTQTGATGESAAAQTGVSGEGTAAQTGATAEAAAQAGSAEDSTAEGEAAAEPENLPASEAMAAVTEDGAVSAQSSGAVQTETSQNGQNTVAESENAGDTAAQQMQETAVRSTQAAYVIKNGDTLAGISEKYYGSIERVMEICEANAITDANMIMPGQKIILP